MTHGIAARPCRNGTPDSPNSQRERRISLIDSLSGEWLKLPLAAMREVGPVVQTLGGILNMTNKETFSAVREIATKARSPLATVRKHLAILHETGWTENIGRQTTRAGVPRRTCTIRVARKTRESIHPWSFLPWWGCCSLGRAGRLPWSSRALLSLVMARLCALKGVDDQMRKLGYGDEEPILGGIEKLGGDDRFRFSLDYIVEETGLARASIIQAKSDLKRVGIIKWYRGEGAHDADLLVPNHDFRVISRSIGDGLCSLEIQGFKSGQ